jgi:DNA primase
MDAEQAKLKNIIEMAFGFSAMTRVFEKESTEKIVKRLNETLSQITSSKNDNEFESLHAGFCRWFKDNIKTAERKKNGVVIKKSGHASYGQGGKVLDVALKVYVYYCHLPNPETAERITKWLHAAIDTNMMKHLKALPEGKAVSAKAVEQVDEDTYTKLKALVRKDIERNFPTTILPVQWDDIKWRCLNKK